MKRVVIVFALIGLLVLSAACSAGAPAATKSAGSAGAAPAPTAAAAAAAKQTLKIGLAAPLTGSSSTWGNGVVQGSNAVIDAINAQGGLKVGNTAYTLQPVVIDDKYTGEGGAEAANRLVFQEGVKFSLGPMGTAPAVTSIPIFTQNKVISVDASTEQPSKDRPYRFAAAYPPPGAWYPAYAVLTKKFPDAKNIAIVTATHEMGTRHGTIAKDEILPAFNLKLAAYRTYEPGTTDFNPIMSALIAAKPDVIETAGSGSKDIALIAKQARQQGYKGMIWASGTVLTPQDLLSIAGPAADGVYGTGFEPTSSNYPAEIKEFDQQLATKYGAQKGDVLIAKWYYYSATGLFKAIEKAGTLDTDKVASTLRDLSWDALGRKGLRYGGEKAWGIKNLLISEMQIIGIEQGKVITIGFQGPEDLVKLPPYQ